MRPSRGDRERLCGPDEAVAGGTMKRRARTAGAAGRERRKTLLRLGTILALVLMAAAALLPHAVSADSPYTHISPRTPDARDIQVIYKLIFWMALVVFVGV